MSNVTEQVKKFKFEQFVKLYGKSMPKIILTNLLFAVFLFSFSALFYLLSTLSSGSINILIIALAVIPSFPFYAGVTLVTRNIFRGDKDVNVVKDFFRGVRDNLLKFLIIGALFYIAFEISYFCLSFYLSVALGGAGLFWAFFFITVIIVVFLLFTFYYIPVMTVTFDLTFRNIIKNSALMSFGELKNNFFATLGLVILTALVFTITTFVSSAVALAILLLILFGMFLPATASGIINFYVYDSMSNMIISKGEKETSNLTKEEKKEIIDKEIVEDFSKIDVDKLSHKDEFVFYNGKMVKQSVLLEKIKEQEENNNE